MSKEPTPFRYDFDEMQNYLFRQQVQGWAKWLSFAILAIGVFLGIVNAIVALGTPTIYPPDSGANAIAAFFNYALGSILVILIFLYFYFENMARRLTDTAIRYLVDKKFDDKDFTEFDNEAGTLAGNQLRTIPIALIIGALLPYALNFEASLQRGFHTIMMIVILSGTWLLYETNRVELASLTKSAISKHRREIRKAAEAPPTPEAKPEPLLLEQQTKLPDELDQLAQQNAKDTQPVK